MNELVVLVGAVGRQVPLPAANFASSAKSFHKIKLNLNTFETNFLLD